MILSNPESNLYVDNQIPDTKLFPSPRLFSTHIPYFSLAESVRKTRACKIVYLCRNPKDVFVSFWHFAHKLRLHDMGTDSLAPMFDQFCNGMCSFRPICTTKKKSF